MSWHGVPCRSMRLTRKDLPLALGSAASSLSCFCRRFLDSTYPLELSVSQSDFLLICRYSVAWIGQCASMLSCDSMRLAKIRVNRWWPVPSMPAKMSMRGRSSLTGDFLTIGTLLPLLRKSKSAVCAISMRLKYSWSSASATRGVIFLRLALPPGTLVSLTFGPVSWGIESLAASSAAVKPGSLIQSSSVSERLSKGRSDS
mmetsp:Transcript_21646/g.69084  ORF Transcript_21646/g.69084 Transcript_21646/m.69084 type:complete len:201 (+) Transcript_21646:1123-1725(+)